MHHIYVIYHLTFINANVFTLDKESITDIIRLQSEKYHGTTGEWRWRRIVEGEEFEADMNMMAMLFK